MPKGTFNIDFEGSQASKCIKTQSFSPAPLNHSVNFQGLVSFYFRLGSTVITVNMGHIPLYAWKAKGVEEMAHISINPCTLGDFTESDAIHQILSCVPVASIIYTSSSWLIGLNFKARLLRGFSEVHPRGALC